MCFKPRKIKAVLGLALMLCACQNQYVSHALSSQKEFEQKKQEVKENPEKAETVAEDLLQYTKDAVLEQKILDLIEQSGIDQNFLSVAVINPDTKRAVSFNGNKHFYAASLYKLPLAMLYYDAINQGLLSLDQTYVFDPLYLDEQGTIAWGYDLEEEIPLGELLETAVEYSDNNAGHLLFEHVNDFIDRLEENKSPALKNWKIHQANQDALQISLKNNPLDASLKNAVDFAYEENFVDVLSASFMIDCLQTIYDHPEDYELLIADLMEAQPYDFLNQSMEYRYAQKYGQYENALNIAGLSLENPHYLVVVLSEYDEDLVLDFMDRLSVLLQEYDSQSTV